MSEKKHQQQAAVRARPKQQRRLFLITGSMSSPAAGQNAGPKTAASGLPTYLVSLKGPKVKSSLVVLFSIIMSLSGSEHNGQLDEKTNDRF